MKLIRLKKKHIFSNLSIECIPVNHGNIDSVSFIINKKLAYASDAKLIYEKNINIFKNLKYFIVDCLSMSTSFTFQSKEVLDLVEKIKPEKTILTNLHSDMDYRTLKKLPQIYIQLMMVLN